MVWKAKFQWGHTTAEYGLVGGLVAVAAIVALLTMGKSLSHVFGTAATSKNATLEILSTKATPIASSPTHSSNSANATNKAPVYFTTGKGTRLTLNGALSDNVGNLVSTVGANGATTVLADSIAAIAGQLKAAGDITDTQYNALINLSNQGHNLAHIERQIEDIVATSSSTTEVITRFSNNSDITSKDDSSNNSYYFTIGYTSENNSDGNTIEVTAPLSTSQANDSTRAFLQAYDQAVKSGALSDPGIMALISGLTSNIGTMSHMVSASSGQIAWGELAMDQQTKVIASQLMHEDSAIICVTGSGTDSGVSCSVN
jgi:Flp pilus assembly pilin Flp